METLQLFHGEKQKREEGEIVTPFRKRTTDVSASFSQGHHRCSAYRKRWVSRETDFRRKPMGVSAGLPDDTAVPRREAGGIGGRDGAIFWKKTHWVCQQAFRGESAGVPRTEARGRGGRNSDIL